MGILKKTIIPTKVLKEENEKLMMKEKLTSTYTTRITLQILWQ